MTYDYRREEIFWTGLPKPDLNLLNEVGRGDGGDNANAAIYFRHLRLAEIQDKNESWRQIRFRGK